MINALAIILVMQLAGEGLARLSGLGVPGPVIGLALFAIVLSVMPRLRETVEPVATFLLANLSLLFVPAAVGLIQHLEVFATEWLAISVALGFSTLLTLAVTAIVFVKVDSLLMARKEQS